MRTLTEGTQIRAGEERLREAEELLGRRALWAAFNAFDAADQAGAEKDRCCAGRWQAQMLLGNFEAAWRESDAIRARGAEDPHRFWMGEEIGGLRVMLRCLHGLGDALQMLRYVPMLRARAASVTVEVPPGLVELARCFAGVYTVITWGEGAPVTAPEWDVQVEIVELPYLFHTSVKDLPLAVKYLQVPSETALRWAKKMGAQKLRVGVVWASGEWNPQRSVPLAQMASLFAVQGCEFWNLQGGDARAEWQRLEDSPALRNDESCAGNLLELAGLVSQLDLVITPDTLAAHLAGALGVEAWVMLEYAADWRWMQEREDSPWYPEMRLFRQRETGGWRDVLQEVKTMLVERVQDGREL